MVTIESIDECTNTIKGEYESSSEGVRLLELILDSIEANVFSTSHDVNRDLKFWLKQHTSNSLGGMHKFIYKPTKL